MGSKSRSNRSREDVDTGMNRVRDRARANASRTPRQVEAATARREAAKSVAPNMMSAAQSVAQAGVDIQRSLSALGEQLLNRNQELEALNQAIAAKREELEELDHKDILAADLDILIADHDKQVAEMEADIQERRLSWAKEQQEHSLAVRLRNEAVEQAHRRDEEAYRYETERNRKIDNDNFLNYIADRKLAEQRRLDEFERKIAEREAAMEAREQELLELRAKVSGIPEMIEAEAKKRVAIVTATMAKDHNHNVEVMQVRHQSGLAEVVASNNSLRAENARLKDELAGHKDLLRMAQEQVAQTAARALDAASGRQALAEVSSIVQRDNGAAPSRKS